MNKDEKPRRLSAATLAREQILNAVLTAAADDDSNSRDGASTLKKPPAPAPAPAAAAAAAPIKKETPDGSQLAKDTSKATAKTTTNVAIKEAATVVAVGVVEGEEGDNVPSPRLGRRSHTLRGSQQQPGAVSVNQSGSEQLRLGHLTSTEFPSSPLEDAAARLPSAAEDGNPSGPFAAADLELGVGLSLERQQQASSDDASLAEARPVEDETIHAADEVVEMKEQQGTSHHHQTLFLGMNQKMLLVGGVILVVAGLFFGLGVTYGRGSSSNENGGLQETVAPIRTATLSPSSPEAAGVSLELAELLSLPQYSVQAIQDDPASPQARAYQWLLEDTVAPSPWKDAPAWKQVQRFALVTIFYALQGEGWTLQEGWLDHNLDECQDWFFRKQISSAPQMGLSVVFIHESEIDAGERVESPCSVKDGDNSDGGGRYEILSLTDNNLAGFLPREVSLLAELNYLDISANEALVGSIPSEIGLLTQLQRFFTNRNFITGSIPTEVGTMVALEMIDMGHCAELSGPIPSEFGELEATLKVFSTQRSGVTGRVPTELFRLTNLEELLIHQSVKITGGSLEGIGNLSNLREFVAHDIPFKTSIPSEIGLLTNLLNFNLWNCQLTGSIPMELWNVTSLRRIDIDDNFLSGTFPNELGQLSLLQVLYINGNKLTGTFPAHSWERMRNLTVLNIGGNSGGNALIGTLPTELGFLTGMLWLGINMMNITGTIPSELGNAPGMQKLFFHDTMLSGSIPQELAAMTDLEVFTVSHTSLTGSIPEELCYGVKEVTMKCLEHFGVYGIVCTGFETHEFSCSESMLCGCDCAHCA